MAGQGRPGRGPRALGRDVLFWEGGMVVRHERRGDIIVRVVRAPMVQLGRQFDQLMEAIERLMPPTGDLRFERDGEELLVWSPEWKIDGVW